MTPRPQDPAATLQALADWPDLDTQQGLRSLAGKADRYLAMLGRLADTHGPDAAALVQALGDGNLAELRRIAHRLAGSAGLLGAVTVMAAARRLDRPDLPQLDAALVRQDADDLVAALGRLLWGLAERAGIRAAVATPATLPAGAHLAQAGPAQARVPA